MVNQEAIRKWYIALKDGSYKQGKSRLRDLQDNYCCWGVACELSGLGTWRTLDNGYDFVLHELADDDYYRRPVVTAMPAHQVVQWLGISMNAVTVPPEIASEHEGLKEYRPFTFHGLNDDGVSFDTIADLIWFHYGEGDPPEVPTDG